MGGSESKHVNLANPAGVRLPMSFDVFYKKSLTSVKLYLAQEKNQPLYAAQLTGGWWSDAQLFNGPDPDAGELGRIKDNSKLGGDCTIIMPPLNHGNQPIMEEMRAHGGSMKTHSYVFPCMVGPGDKARPEKFEWIRAGKDELRSLGMKKKIGSEGWKLIRHANGGEVIAVCSTDYSVGFSKTGSLEFLGSAATGEMGDLWYLMATMTYLRLWQRYMRSVMCATIVGNTA